MKYLYRSLSIVSACAVIVSCGSNAPKADPQAQAPVEEIVPNVTVISAAYQDVALEDTYPSTVQAYAINNITPQSASRIRKINVEIGDYVRAGQVLAQMDPLNLEQSRLKLANDSTELSRIRQLYQAGGVSKSDFEAMELAYNVSKSSYQNLVENTVLRSPLNGVITARNYDVGDMYAMASPIFVVQQITPVKILVAISESDYSKVKKGDTVTITADAMPSETFTGKVNRIYPTLDAATHTFQAEVTVSNLERKLRPGMYVRVTVSFGMNHSIVIPDMAVVKQQGSGQKAVYIVDADGTAVYTVVQVGKHQGTEYEILSGLSEGDRVVVKGQTTLKNGSKVNIVE